MELWIRSQDRECLMKVDRVDIDLTNGTYKIKANGFEVILGEYEYKSRALEVLDEIQKYIVEIDKAVIYSQTSIEDYSNVYEMPIE